jgi:hypothetical protein
MEVSVVVEGHSDEGVAERMLALYGMKVKAFYGKKGKTYLLKSISGYNRAALYAPWFALVDLDGEPCVVEARREWLECPSPLMCFHIAVREIESWLLADRKNISRFLGVSRDLIPLDPDVLVDPKQALVNLARKSRKREVRDGLAPREGSGASVGPTYVSDIRLFASREWNPLAAAENSQSLKRCLGKLEGLSLRVSNS